MMLWCLFLGYDQCWWNDSWWNQRQLSLFVSLTHYWYPEYSLTLLYLIYIPACHSDIYIHTSFVYYMYAPNKHFCTGLFKCHFICAYIYTRNLTRFDSIHDFWLRYVCINTWEKERERADILDEMCKCGFYAIFSTIQS